LALSTRTVRCRFDKIARMVFHRLFEWAMAMALFGLGVHLTLFPNAIAASSFDHIIRTIPEHWLAGFFLVIGMARVSALIVNGASPNIGPKVRGVASSASAMVWAQLAYSLYVHSIAGDIPPLVINVGDQRRNGVAN